MSCQKNDPPLKECIDFKQLLKISGSTLSVECEPSEPPPTPVGQYRCIAPFPSKVTIGWSAGDNKLGAYPLTRTRQERQPTIGPFLNKYLNIETELEPGGSDPEWSLSFSRDNLIASRYYSEIGPLWSWRGQWPQGLGYNPQWNPSPTGNVVSLGLDLNVYSLDQVLYGQTLTARTKKKRENWQGGWSDYVPILGTKVCEDEISYEAEFIHVVVGTIKCMCMIEDTRWIPPQDDNRITHRFTGKIASGFVANKIKDLDMYTRDTRIHMVCLGLLMSMCEVDPTVPVTELFGANQFYQGPGSYPNPPAFYPVFPESNTAYNYMGWPKYGTAEFWFDYTKRGDVLNAQIHASNGIQFVPSGGYSFGNLPPIVNPVTMTVTVDP